MRWQTIVLALEPRYIHSKTFALGASQRTENNCVLHASFSFLSIKTFTYCRYAQAEPVIKVCKLQNKEIQGKHCFKKLHLFTKQQGFLLMLFQGTAQSKRWWSYSRQEARTRHTCYPWQSRACNRALQRLWVGLLLVKEQRRREFRAHFPRMTWKTQPDGFRRILLRASLPRNSWQETQNVDQEVRVSHDFTTPPPFRGKTGIAVSW